jgi:BirA family transcriptional regulator, biotin operon repressor / biotin---[acetyl-CoA-carboxylase] ligase
LKIAEIKSRLRGEVGREIFFHETISSTNTIASEIAAKTVEGAVIIADTQSRGKGRLGRIWVSPPGVNIYMSIILRPDIRPRDATLITIMSSVACANALRKVTGLNVTIKWPNDLIIQNRKLCGILTELKTERNKIIFAVAGIGINVNMDINEFPEDVKYIATSLKNETGIVYSRTEIVAETLNEMDRWYKTLKVMDRDALLSEWKRLSSILSREVMVVTGQGTVTGLALDLDNEGMLMIKLASGEVKKISSGEVTIVR